MLVSLKVMAMTLSKNGIASFIYINIFKINEFIYFDLRSIYINFVAIND